MMSWLKDLLDNPSDALHGAVLRYQNRQFLESTVAACAIVAAADGKIDAAEKQKMMGFMQISEELKVFPISDVLALFKKSVDVFNFDYEVGKQAALKTVSKLRGNDGAARTMIRVCCLIGAADGNFDPDEKKAVADICGAVGISPTDFL